MGASGRFWQRSEPQVLKQFLLNSSRLAGSILCDTIKVLEMGISRAGNEYSGGFAQFRWKAGFARYSAARRQRAGLSPNLTKAKLQSWQTKPRTPIACQAPKRKKPKILSS